jgi:hypothetical protein
MPPATTQTKTAPKTPPSANPEHPTDEPTDGGTQPGLCNYCGHDHDPQTSPHPAGHPADVKSDPATVKADDSPGLYVVAFADPHTGAQIAELHTDETAEARVTGLTYGSKQHRKAVDDDDEAADLPEGGGSHEINRKDVRVYKLNTTEVTDF